MFSSLAFQQNQEDLRKEPPGLFGGARHQCNLPPHESHAAPRPARRRPRQPQHRPPGQVNSTIRGTLLNKDNPNQAHDEVILNKEDCPYVIRASKFNHKISLFQ
jgi:hypothetical protein